MNTGETFEKELEHLINKYSKESDSDTPDFILASYISDCMKAFASAIKLRENWYGRGDQVVKDVKEGGIPYSPR